MLQQHFSSITHYIQHVLIPHVRYNASHFLETAFFVARAGGAGESYHGFHLHCW